MRNLNHLAAILLLCCLLCPLSLNAEKWTAETLPMVYLQDVRRHVCNPDGVLDEATVSSTDSLLTALEKDKGVQTVVVAVKQIEGGDPYEFGMSLARKHGIGSAKQNSGLIVVLATEDRAYQILTGTGLEGTLPDAICSRIERRVMVPRLKRGEWGPAISETMKAIDGYIRGDESLTAEEDGEDDRSLGLEILCGLIFVGFWTFLFVALSVQQKCPKCKQAHLRVVKRQRVKISNRPGWHMCETLRCPRCGHEKVV